MRPKKAVFCVCGDEQKLSRRRFLLANKRYRVFSAENLEEMNRTIADQGRSIFC